MVGLYTSSQSLVNSKTDNKADAPTPPTSSKNMARPNLSSSLENILNGSALLKNNWTDRFVIKSQSLGASSFAQLGAMKFDNEAGFSRQSEIHTSLVFNSHAAYYAKNTTSRNLEYLNEVAKSFSDMVNSIKQLGKGNGNELAKLEYKLEDSGAVASHFSRAAVTSFNMLENTLGIKQNQGEQSLVLDSKAYTQKVLETDYNSQTFGAMKQRATTEYVEDEAATLKEGDKVLNELFGKEMFKDGKLNFQAIGIEEGGFKALVNDPEKLQEFAKDLESALVKVQETIVAQGQQLKTLKGADDFYENALNQYDEGRYGPTTLASLQNKVNGFSLLDRTSFVTDFWAEQIETKRENNLLSWLNDTEKNLKKHDPFAPLEINKGTEKEQKILNSFAKLEERNNADTNKEVKTPKQVIEALTHQIFDAGLEVNSGKFGPANESLIEQTQKALDQLLS